VADIPRVEGESGGGGGLLAVALVQESRQDDGGGGDGGGRDALYAGVHLGELVVFFNCVIIADHGNTTIVDKAA